MKCIIINKKLIIKFVIIILLVLFLCVLLCREKGIICNYEKYDCRDFDNQEESQKYFNYCYPEHGDIHDLDRDNDNITCESLNTKRINFK